MKNSGKNFLLLLCAFGAGIVLQFVAAIAVMLPATLIKQMQIISMGLHGTPEETIMMNELTEKMLGVTVFVTHIILLACFVLWYNLECRKKIIIIREIKNVFQGRNVAVILLLAVGCCYLVNFAMVPISQIIPESIMQAYIDLMENAGFGNSILPTVTAVLIAPFGEELIFRGVIYHYGTGMTAGMSGRKLAFYLTNVIQALAFGIFHGNLVQGSYAFVLGLALGYLRERYGSIWAPIMAHMVINLCSSFLWEPLVNILPETNAVYLSGAVVAAVVVVAALKLGGPTGDNTPA